MVNTGLYKAFSLLLLYFLFALLSFICNKSLLPIRHSLSVLFSLWCLPVPCTQALERQKEYFDCIRIERDELRDELADLKETMKTGEVR